MKADHLSYINSNSEESDLTSIDSDEEDCSILNPNDGKDLNFKC